MVKPCTTSQICSVWFALDDMTGLAGMWPRRFGFCIARQAFEDKKTGQEIGKGYVFRSVFTGIRQPCHVFHSVIQHVSISAEVTIVEFSTDIKAIRSKNSRGCSRFRLSCLRFSCLPCRDRRRRYRSSRLCYLFSPRRLGFSSDEHSQLYHLFEQGIRIKVEPPQ